MIKFSEEVKHEITNALIEDVRYFVEYEANRVDWDSVWDNLIDESTGPAVSLDEYDLFKEALFGVVRNVCHEIGSTDTMTYKYLLEEFAKYEVEGVIRDEC